MTTVVKCINNKVGASTIALTVNKFYNVVGTGDDYYTVKNDKSRESNYLKTRFEVVNGAGSDPVVPVQVALTPDNAMKGIKVKCLNNNGADLLVVGSIYIVSDVDRWNHKIEVTNRANNKAYYAMKRFVIVKDPAPVPAKPIKETKVESPVSSVITNPVPSYDGYIAVFTNDFDDRNNMIFDTTKEELDENLINDFDDRAGSNDKEDWTVYGLTKLSDVVVSNEVTIKTK